MTGYVKYIIGLLLLGFAVEWMIDGRMEMHQDNLHVPKHIRTVTSPEDVNI